MEYIDMINKIVEAEHQAQEIAEDTKRKRESFSSELEQEIEDIRQKYDERVKRRVEMFAEREHAYLEEQIAALDKKLEGELAEINRVYEENADKWVDELFERVTGRS